MDGSSSCGYTGTSGDCSVKCRSGDILEITVKGTGNVSGTFSCGGVTVSCQGKDTCHQKETRSTRSSGEGDCDLILGREIECLAKN